RDLLSRYGLSTMLPFRIDFPTASKTHVESNPDGRARRKPLPDLLNDEILRAERQRILILTLVFGMAFLAFLILPPVLTPDSIVKFQGGLTRFHAVLLFAATAIYGAAMSIAVSRLLRARRRTFRLLRYASSVAETTLITFMLVLSAPLFGPACAVLTPLPFLYFVVIIVAVLRLDAMLCAFTGTVVAVQYTALATYYVHLDRFTDKQAILLDPVHHIEKGALFFLSGLAAAFIAHRVRRAVERALESVEARHHVTEVFGQFVSPPVVEQLLNESADAQSECRHVCVMFLDIRNFTTFSEKTPADEVVDYLNHLFSPMIEIVGNHNGIINKFLGDGFMAVFGAPISTGEEASDAISASREILEEVDRMTERGDIPPTRIGIGLHAGDAIVGNVGSADRKEYTVIGDVVNITARIETLNKRFGSRLLVSESVWKSWDRQERQGESLGPVDLNGRIQVVNLFRLA
ncbi:MAG: hypothetical protein O3A46_17005, partial [Candidatus Poribacteria bacterium]|nr:hypothetical protein [Candidatus Poribacteria bacterium]